MADVNIDGNAAEVIFMQAINTIPFGGKTIPLQFWTNKLDNETISDSRHERKYTSLTEAEHHNAVFVRYDDKGVSRYATQRGTLSDKSFKCDCGTESDKSFGFLIKGKPESALVYVFEAPIDALSCATFENRKGIDLHKTVSYHLAVCGTALLNDF